MTTDMCVWPPCAADAPAPDAAPAPAPAADAAAAPDAAPAEGAPAAEGAAPAAEAADAADAAAAAADPPAEAAAAAAAAPAADAPAEPMAVDKPADTAADTAAPMETSEPSEDAVPEGFDEQVKLLDINLLYLWRVHGVDYYAGLELAEPSEWGVHLVQPRTLRGPRPEEGEEADPAQGRLHLHRSLTGKLKSASKPTDCLDVMVHLQNFEL